MTMCDAPTWADEEQRAAALVAGWLPHDIEWECREEAAVTHCINGEHEQAAALWHTALQLAQTHFADDDPRLGCALANAANAAAADGEDDDLLRQAQEVWQHSPMWIDRILPATTARSSVHHFRMVQKNRAAYQTQIRRRLHDAAAHARALLDRQIEKSAADQLALWRKEKPPVFNDSRKLLAACYLMVWPITRY